jgi:hydroxymethylpyrimidine/phosphomethylpyrimidine kinase
VLVDAAGLARAYLVEAIARAPDLGRGHGPVDHGWPARDPETFARLMQTYRLS